MKTWRVPYPKFAARPGLARVTRIAARLGLDLPGFGAEAAVIVGSNGKGSTAAMCAALLERTGETVGLFTSPHLLALNERLRLNGADIADDELAQHWGRVEAAVEAERAETGEQAGGFEFLFLIAADWFAERGARYTVWEAGLGGRLDPTRLIAARQLALTSLDFEHTHLLGETLEEIAREKVAAAPAGARLFAPRSIAAPEAVARACAAQDVELVVRPPLAEGVPLAGAHQADNAALALALAQSLAPLAAHNVEAGFAATRWPGRLEILDRDPLVVLDVGHTPAAVRAARAGFEAVREGRAAVLVCGVSEDKDLAAIVADLAPGFDWVACASPAHKGAPATHVAAAVSAANPAAEIVLAESVAEARASALTKARRNGAAVYVAGGLFLAAEFRALHYGVDPARLAFF